MTGTLPLDLAPLPPDHPNYLPDNVYLDGARCRLERVKLNDLAAWMDRHGLEYHRTADMGRLGLVTIFWPVIRKEKRP